MLEHTRRHLLRLAPAAALMKAAAIPVNIGIVTEPGGTHLDLFAKGLAKCPEVGTVAIADASGKSFEMVRAALGPLAGGLRTYASHREMLSALKPDLAIVTVEPRNNPALVEDALKANAHVLCEKPAAVRLSDFERVAALAESRQRLLMMAMATRGNPSVREAKRLIDLGWFGKVYGVSMTWIGDHTRLTTRAWQESWYSHKERAGGGKLGFHGVHYLDLIHHLLGDRIVRISGLCRNVGEVPIDVEDAAVVALEFSKGALGTMNVGYYLDKGFSNYVHIWGEKGWIRFDPLSPLRWESTHADAPKGEQSFSYAGPDPAYDVMMADIVKGFSGGRPFMTTAESLHVTRVVFAGYKSSETNRTQSV